ncbi:MAG: PKD domain-containing protein [Bacteroidales bacterium]
MLVLLFLLILTNSLTSQEAKYNINPDDIPEVSFLYTEGSTNYFSIDFLNTEPDDKQFIINLLNKQKVFVASNYNLSDGNIIFYTQYNPSLTSAEQITNVVVNAVTYLHLYKDESPAFCESDIYNINNSDGTREEIGCETAEVSCSDESYSFPSGTTGNATTPIGGYPNYHCLSSRPAPAWFYMQFDEPGDINIHIEQWSQGDPPVGRDVDFCCWGPFNTLMEGCETGLTGDNVVDCSYSAAPIEDCYIPNGQPGEIYILLITNYSRQPATITFSQSMGSGHTNCNIVYQCGIISLTANPSTCDENTNTYNLTGNIEFVNAPEGGVLEIVDINSGLFTTLNPPFVSPMSYTISGIPCDGQQHTVEAVFIEADSCMLTQTYTSPAAVCPIATISGGGNICQNGIDSTEITINFTSIPPFTFSYSRNDTVIETITDYNGLTYSFWTKQGGVYRVDSVSNLLCPGTTSGNAIVNTVPLPTPSIIGENNLCVNSTRNYTTQAGFINYTWNLSPGATVIGGGGFADEFITINFTNPGTYILSLNYQTVNPISCFGAKPDTIVITVNPLPSINIAGTTPCCVDEQYLYTTEPGMTDYLWTISGGGTIISGEDTEEVTIEWNVPGVHDVFVNYVDANGCTLPAPESKQIVVHPLPTAYAGANAAICANGTYTINDSDTTNSIGVTWTTDGTGTFDDVNILHPTYTPSNADTTNGSVTLTITAEGIPPCEIATSSMVLTFNPLPLPTYTGDISVCLNSTHTYTAPAGMNNYLWTLNSGGNIIGPDNQQTVTIIWETAGDHTLSVNYTDPNGCRNPVPHSKTITVNALPVITITGTTPCCVNEQYVYTTEPGMTNYLWTLSGGGNFVGPINTNEVTVEWNTPGVHNVYVNYTDLNGCTLPDPESMQVVVHPLPTAYAGANAAICANDTYTINDSDTTHSTGVTWATSGTGSFNNVYILHPTYTPSNADTTNGSVTLTITANGKTPCQSVTSSMVLTFNPLPIPTYNGNISVCLNSTQTYIAPPGMSDYLWNLSGGGTIVGANNQQTVDITWNTDGVHILSVNYTDPNGCRNPVPHSKDITVNDLITPTVTGLNSVCQNTTGVTYTTEAGMTNYSWTISGGGTITSGATTNEITVSWHNPGTHTLSVTYVDPNGCESDGPGALDVTVHPLPTPTINGDNQVCHLTENNYSTEAGHNNYIWNVTGGTIISGNGSPNINVRWDVVGNNQISVNYTTVFGCTAPTPTTLAVEVLALPAPVVSGPPSVCLLTEGNMYSTATGFVNYTWSVSGANIIGASTGHEVNLSWNTPGTKPIGVTVVDAYGCVGTSNPFEVIVNQLPVPSLNGSNIGCVSVGGNVYSTDAGMTNYVWTVTGGSITTGQGTNSIEVLWTDVGTQTVSVTYIDNNGCSPLDATHRNVSVGPYPIAFAGDDDYICSSDGSYTFNGSSGTYYDNTNIQWTFYGEGYTSDGTLNNPNILHPTFTPGPIDISTPGRLITFILTLEGSGSCVGNFITDTVQLQIDPFPEANAGENATVCGFTPHQLNGSVTYQNAIEWTTSGSGTFSDIHSLNPTYTAGVSDVGHTIELTLNTTGCRGLVNSSSMWLTVNNYPYGEIICDTAICEGEQAIITFNLRGTPPWDLIYTNGLVNDTIIGITSSPHQISITPATSITHWIRELKDALCTAPGDSLVGSTNIEVHALPILYNLVASHNGTYCAGAAGVEITLTNSEVGVSYQLIYNTLPLGAPVLGDGNPINFGIHSAQGQYYVEATNISANCTIMMLDTVTVIMTPIPVTDFSFSQTCMGDSTYFTLSGNYLDQISLYEWDFGDGNHFTSNSLVNPSHLYVNSGTYTVTLHVVDIYDCEYTISHTVEIQPNPNSFFSYSSINCLGDSTYFHDLSVPAGSYIAEWVWDFGDGTTTTVIFPNSADVSHLYSVAGVYTVSLTITDARGCTSTYSKDITIHNVPIAEFTHSQGCQGQTIYFVDESQNAQGGNITEWLWNFGDPASGVNNTSTLQNPEHVYANGGLYNVELIVYNLNGCSDTIVKTITINEGATADFFYTNNCKNDTSFFYIDSTATNIQAIANYHWNFGDGGVASGANTYHIYNESGTYVVVLTVTDTSGCITKVQKSIDVYESPVSNFSHVTEVCTGNVVAFNDLSYSNQGYIETAEWDFGDGSTLVLNHPNITDVEHTYTLPGVYQVKLVVYSSLGCKSEKTSLITVNGIDIEEIIYTGTCEGHYTEFSYVYTVSAGNSVVSQSWNFGDPASGTNNFSTLANPRHIYNTPGIYTVTLTVNTSKGCSTTTSYDIEVYAEPDVDFTFISSCTGNPTVFNSTSSAGVIHWLWDFGDGNASNIANPEHIYTVAGTYYVTLTVTDTNGCSNTASRTLTVNAGPQPMYTYNQPLCASDSVVFINVTPPVIGGHIVRYEWDFGDGNTFTQPANSGTAINHMYAQGGQYMVVLTAITSDSCSNSYQEVLSIGSTPFADFSVSSSCVGAPTSFTDQSVNTGASQIVQWMWNFGDPTSGVLNYSSVPSPTHTYNTAGTYDVTLTVYNSKGCWDSIVKQVIVNDLAEVTIENNEGCNGSSISFSAVSNVDLQTYYWDFDDGNSSSLSNPVHVYENSGQYNVTLTAKDINGCTAITTKTITIYPKPIASFANSNPLCNDSTVVFTDLSHAVQGAITQWRWHFGDGNDTTYTAYQPTVTHSYSQQGSFEVKLVVESDLGCTDSIIRILTISDSPDVDFSYTSNCMGSNTQFTSTVSAGSGASVTSYAWDFGDPNSGILNYSNLQNPTHIYINSGTYTVRLTVTNSLGCSAYREYNVEVYDKPDVEFTYTKDGCVGTPLVFSVDSTITNVTNVTYYNWDFGDGTFVQNQSVVTHAYSLPGTYNVSLDIRDISGCTNKITHQVIIHSSSISQFTYNTACSGKETTFTDMSIAPAGDTIVAWLWNFGYQGDTSVLQHPVYVYNNPGVYNVSLTTITEHGCANTVTVPIQIWDKPVPDFSYSVTPCSNGMVQFYDNSTSHQSTITEWIWEFEPGQYGSGSSPQHQYYAKDSCYNVQLIVINDKGCSDTIIKQVCVPPDFEIDISYTKGCVGEDTQFEGLLIAPHMPLDTIVSCVWNFGDPESGANNISNALNPTHRYSTSREYTVLFEATDMYGCIAYAEAIVDINLEVKPQITYTQGICDSTVTFEGLGNDNSAVYTQYSWDFGDGNTYTDTLNTATNKYQEPGIYQVILTMYNDWGCSGSDTANIEVKACLIANYTSDSIICEGQKAYFVDSSNSLAQITRRYWNFGDGSDTTYQNYVPVIEHTYENQGVYTTKFVIEANVGGVIYTDSIEKQIIVRTSPIANFITQNQCWGRTVEFVDSSSNYSNKRLIYRWDFGDNNTSQDTSSMRNPRYYYNSPGTYNVTLRVNNIFGCADSIVKSIDIHQPPTANFESSLSCSGKNTYFFDASSSSTSELIRWGWTMIGSNGEVAYMEGRTPQYNFGAPGSYKVNMTVADTSGCTDSISKYVTVYASPISAFRWNKNVDGIQGKLQMINGTIGAQNYYWDFGNGTFSQEKEPTVTYNYSGDYTITLVSVNEYGCVDTARAEYKLMFKGLYIPNAFVPDGGNSELRVWKPVGMNLATYRAEVYNQHGNLIWSSNKLTSQGEPAEGWNGKYKDKPCPQDVYVYRVYATFRDGTVWRNNDVGERKGLDNSNSGTITLVR